MLNHSIKKQWLLAGILLIIFAGVLWFLAWRQAGMGLPPGMEKLLPVGVLVFGFLTLSVYMMQLSLPQLDHALKILALWTSLLSIGGILSLHHYQAFFDLVHFYPIDSYQPQYLTAWRRFFYQPMLFAVWLGSLILWLLTLVFWRVGQRKLSKIHNSLGSD